MRRWILVTFLFVLVVAAQGIGYGLTVAPRVLFPLYYPYIFEDENIEQGVMVGFKFSFDLRLFPGFSAGPYLGGLFHTDTQTLPSPFGEIVIESHWTDLVIGARFKYAIPTGGPWRPWISTALGYGVLNCTFCHEDDRGTYETDYDNTGGFGLDTGIGVDYWFSDMLFVGFGADFHLNTADKLERVIDGETYESELKESPVGLGVGVNLGFVF